MDLATVIFRFAWCMNAFAVGTVIVTRIFSHTRATWAFAGFVLLACALGNAVLTSIVLFSPEAKGNLSLSIPLQATALFGLVVFGSLGSRFLGEWLTSGARN